MWYDHPGTQFHPNSIRQDTGAWGLSMNVKLRSYNWYAAEQPLPNQIVDIQYISFSRSRQTHLRLTPKLGDRRTPKKLCTEIQAAAFWG
jgi:hypothetical protein